MMATRFMHNTPFVVSAALKTNHAFDKKTFPGCLPFTKDLNLEFDSPVTFFVGENGSGKSTLLEAIAVLARLPICGGGLNEAAGNFAFKEKSELADGMELAFIKQPQDRYFFRAETQAHFASLLEQRKNDPEFNRDPYQRYGGKSLHQMSHGEAFLSVMQNRFDQGLYLMDEPESALSPQRQLALLALMHDLVSNGGSQFVIATHSPILLTYPGATILSFDKNGPPQPITLEETSHFQITSGILDNPQMYWQHLVSPRETKSGN